MALQDIAAAVQTFLKDVDGIHKVSDRPGGAATWATDKRRGRNYWEIDIRAASEEPAGIGRCAFRYYTVRIDGYMPLSYENPNSAAVWRPLVDTVCDELRSNMSLGQSVNDAGLPQIVTNDRIIFSAGGNAPEVVCHHVGLELRVRRFFTFTTA